MKRGMMATVTTAIVLAGCAGRDPIPVSAYKPNDGRLNCDQIAHEITSNNHNMLTRARESADTNDRNVMMGAAGVLLFAPILLAIDAKDAAATENRAFEERNRVLLQKAREDGCDVPTAYTVAKAEEEIGRSKKSTGSGPAAGKEAADSRVAEVREESHSPAQQRAAPPLEAGDIQDLMGQFLRGEISREEYERARLTVASN